MNQIIFTCQYLEHLKEPINGFCLNLKCKDQTQFCIKCVINKHFDHKERDCKTSNEIQQMMQNDIGQMPNWIQLANQTFRKVEKAQKGLAKLILGERDYLIELKKNLKASNYYLYNKDFLRLKNLNIVIRKMLSPKYKNFFLCILKVMNKIQQTLDNLGESKMNERKQVIKNVELNVNFEQIVQLDVIFNNQIIALCDNEQCFDKQQCCKKCYMKNNKEKSIFVVIMPLIELQITIANQYLQAVETYFKYGQQLNQLFKEFLENQEILLKNMNNLLQVQNFFEFLLNLKKMRKWYKLKEINVKNENYNILSINILDKLILLSKTIFKQIEGENQIIFIKQFDKLTQTKEVDLDLEKKSIELFNQGEQLRLMSRYEDAISCYDQAIQINPKYFQAQNNKGSTLDDLNRYEDAILCYDQAIKINSNFSEAYNNKGYALQKLNRYEDAILCYNKTIKINPNNSVAYYNKGNALDDLNRYEDAILCYNKAIKINPNYSLAYNNQGNSLYKLNRYEDAVFCYDQAININPNYSLAYNNQGIALYKLNRYEDAILCYDQAIKINPNYSSAYNNQGNSLYKLNRYEDAILCYDQAIKINPNYSLAYYSKGSALHNLNRYEDAIQCYNQVLKLDPDDSDALTMKQIIQNKIKQKQEQQIS